MAGQTVPHPETEPAARIGAQLRAARLAARKSMAEVADHAGLTKGFLSKLERDLANVSVASLMRLCEALDISVGSLFSAPKGEVVRAGQYPPINFGGTGIREYLLTPAGEKRVQAIVSEIEPGGGSGDEPYALPADVEFLLVLSGELRIVVAGDHLMLGAGDAFTFASGIAHSFGVPPGAGPARVLWVISPALPDHGLDVQALAREDKVAGGPRPGSGVPVRVVVVGAGITGAACAYAAARLGAEVVLADAGLPGQATAAGAGIICPWSPHERDPVWYGFGLAAARAYPGLVAELAQAGHGDVSYRRTGALMLAGCAEQAGRDAAALIAARAAGAAEMGDVEVLTPDQAVMVFPPLKKGTHAVLVTGAARVDGRLLAAALIRAAVQRGAQLRSGPAELAVAGGRVAGVRLADEVIGADVVVAATGAWTGSFVRPAGAVVRVSPQRGQIAHISVAPADTSRWPVVLPGGSGHYLLAFDDSRVVAGATRETGAGFDPRVTPAGLREVMDEALAVAPGLAGGTHLETRVGLRPASADGLPLLGPVPGADGLIVATGLGASGLTLGPLTGTIAARLALGLDPGTDVAAFSPVRPC